MDSNPFATLLGGMNETNDDDFPASTDPNLVTKLKLACEALSAQPQAFKIGDIVTWKPGLKNKRGVGPYVITRVHAQPVFDVNESAGSPYFNEPLDVAVGEFSHKDGEFIEYHFDSRRLEPYAGDLV